MLRNIFWILNSVIFSTLLLGMLSCAPVTFSDPEIRPTLESGIKHYESGDYSLALIDWHTLLQDPKYARSEEVLYNLALTEFKMHEYGAALAHLRRAQALNPVSFKIYKTINFVRQTIEKKEFYTVDSEPLAKMILIWLPKFVLIALFILCIGAGTFIALSRYREGLGFWPYIRSYVVLALLSLVPLALLVLQINFQSERFATLVSLKPVTIYTKNSLKAPEIGTLKAGDVFQIIKPVSADSEGWQAVTASGTPFGWIKTDAYIVYRGKIDPKHSSH